MRSSLRVKRQAATRRWFGRARSGGLSGQYWQGSACRRVQ
jgi:hypothetical protein